LKSIAGAERPRSGTVSFDGSRIDGMPQHVITSRGIAYVPENRRLFPRLKERHRQQAGTLSGGEQQMLAVSRALMLRPRLLLLDEPSFGLAPMVVQHLFEIFRTINLQDRIGMLLVEQNASMALRLAQHAYLLETGRVVVSGPAEAIRHDETVRRSYLGY
jgi:branched-chain amino acid transport system ATP-binding protein